MLQPMTATPPPLYRRPDQRPMVPMDGLPDDGGVVDPDELERAAQALADKLGPIVGDMTAEAEKRVSERATREEDWFLSLEQYHGKYDAETWKRLKDSTKSKLFINETMQKTNAYSARLMDTLFPTDDRNWAILPTPVPELTAGATKAMDEAKAKLEAADAAEAAAGQPPVPGQPPMPPAQVAAVRKEADDAKAAADKLLAVMNEAKARAKLMADEIDDQLTEGHYSAVMRDVIESACKLGTGVCKGPVTGDQVRKGWKKVDGGSNDYKLETSDGANPHPAFRFVDLWSFFPSMGARNIEESEGVYERHLYNKKQLRALSNLPGFQKDAIRRLLKTKASSNVPDYLMRQRAIRADNTAVQQELYCCWEYSGPLEAEHIRILALAANDQATVTELENIDELVELNVCVWFCQGELLKFAIYPMDSGECMYSVFTILQDEASIFGYGIPALIRDPQKSLNAAWRKMMDNAGIAAGPQIVMKKGAITPQNGSWDIEGPKVWYADESWTAGQIFFASFNIDMHQAEMAAIIEMSMKFIDDMSGVSSLAQGEQGSGVTKTAQGMALLMNSTNVVFRRVVKSFDDEVTKPNIRRIYDWNMQHSTKPEIKGDYEIDARGSSVLMVKELQAQNLMMMATNLGAHPVYGPMLKNREVLRKLVQAQMMPADELVLTDDQIDEAMAKAAAQQQAMAEAGVKAQQELEAKKLAIEEKKLELEQHRLDAEVAKANMDNASKERIEAMKRDTAMMTMASTMNMSLDKINADLMKTRELTQSQERKFAAEAAIEARNAEAARAAGMEPTGSGGSLSGGVAEPAKKKEMVPA